MTGNLGRIIACTVAIGAVACSEATTSPTATDTVSALADAFTTAPLAMGSVNSSFAASADAGALAWAPGGHDGMRDGMRGGPGMHGFMGGIGGDFLGGGFGPGFGRGPFGDDALSGQCTFSAQTGRVSCAAQTFDGLTITRSAAYTSTAGTAQAAVDSTTNTINTQTQVSGTVLRRDGDTSVVSDTSNRTVSGLAKGSTQRTVKGTSVGREKTTGTNRQGHFTASRLAGDTTSGVVIPVVSTGTSYPTAGTVIRAMTATVTYDGQSPVTSTRREVVTYDGSATARIVITQDGQTRTCTVPLPHGQLTCQ